MSPERAGFAFPAVVCVGAPPFENLDSGEGPYAKLVGERCVHRGIGAGPGDSRLRFE